MLAFRSNQTTSINLKDWGADLLHKYLFLELDWMTDNKPNDAAIQDLKGAFAAAPIDAGNGASDSWTRDDLAGSPTAPLVDQGPYRIAALPVDILLSVDIEFEEGTDFYDDFYQWPDLRSPPEKQQ